MADPAPADVADPASSAGRSSWPIRWPIRRHPLADPASSAGRSGVIRLMADPATSGGRDPMPAMPIRRAPGHAIRRSAIRAPRVRVPYGN
jgi:hypothetical protein